MKEIQGMAVIPHQEILHQKILLLTVKIHQEILPLTVRITQRIPRLMMNLETTVMMKVLMMNPMTMALMTADIRIL